MLIKIQLSLTRMSFVVDVLQEGQKLLFEIDIAQHPHGTLCVIVQAHLSNKILDNLILVVHFK